MNAIIKYTLQEYKQSYNELLAKYLSNYFDVAESDFIESEISSYRICLEVAYYLDKNYEKIISSYNRDTKSYPTPKKFQILKSEYSDFNFDAIVKELVDFEGNSFNHSIKQRVLSFNKIISFLENKKSNPEIAITGTAAAAKMDLQKSTELEKKYPFKNNFDNVKENDIIRHFTEFLVDKKYLTESELLEFLIAAFDKKTPPAKRFKFNNLNTKQQIKKGFYNYYKIVAGKPKGKQRQYAELLGEYFNGFDTSKIMTNFSK